jgi:F420H(2)-dependent quinone reductase
MMNAIDRAESTHDAADLTAATHSGIPRGPRRLPPRWFIRSFWVAHRAVYAVTRGRIGLRSAGTHPYGLMRITTIGRRTGVARPVILAYLEDGPNLFTLAMNGWGNPEPAWWLNLQANPNTTVDLPGEARPFVARTATAEERPRLWARWVDLGDGTDEFAALRSGETAVVVLEPRDNRRT